MNLTELGEVAEFINGAAFKPSDWENDGKRIIRIQNLNNPAKPYNRTTKSTKEKYLVPKGTLLVSWSASLGVFEWKESDTAVLNQHIFKVVPYYNKVTQPYLRCMLVKALDDMSKFAHGSTMKHVNRGEFLSVKIPLPPLPEQKRIAAILDQADALRKHRQRALDHLNQLGQSIFYEMFGDYVKFENSQEWPELNSLLSEKLRSGAYYPKESYSEQGTEMVHMSDAFYDQVIRGDLKRVTCSESDRLKYSLNKSDLLIARRSLVFEGAAKPCMIPDSEEPLIFESSFIRVRPNVSDVRTQYLFYYLNLEEIKERFVRPFVTRSTISGINQTNLGAVKIFLPSITDQDEFCRRVQGLNELSKTHDAEHSVFKNLFASLQQRAFRGEL